MRASGPRSPYIWRNSTSSRGPKSTPSFFAARGGRSLAKCLERPAESSDRTLRHSRPRFYPWESRNRTLRRAAADRPERKSEMLPGRRRGALRPAFCLGAPRRKNGGANGARGRGGAGAGGRAPGGSRSERLARPALRRARAPGRAPGAVEGPEGAGRGPTAPFPRRRARAGAARAGRGRSGRVPQLVRHPSPPPARPRRVGGKKPSRPRFWHENDENTPPTAPAPAPGARRPGGARRGRRRGPDRSQATRGGPRRAPAAAKAPVESTGTAGAGAGRRAFAARSRAPGGARGCRRGSGPVFSIKKHAEGGPGRARAREPARAPRGPPPPGVTRRPRRSLRGCPGTAWRSAACPCWR